MEAPARIGVAAHGGAQASSHAGGSVARAVSSCRLVVVVLMASIFTMTAESITDPDFWWHLRTGQLIFETRAVPHADPFSFTARGFEWVAHEWLTEVVMFATYRLAGWGGLVALFSLVMTAALWLACRRAARRGAHVYVACAATLLGAFATAPIWGVRPQMVSFLFTSAFVAVLDAYARDENSHLVPIRFAHERAVRGRVVRVHSARDGDSGTRALWLLVPLTLVWANMHGGFALGLALIALTCAGVALDELVRREGTRVGGDVTAAKMGGESSWVRKFRRVRERARPLCFVFAACMAVAAVNPSGVRLFSYPFETINSGAMQKYIAEWASPNFHLPNSRAFALLLFATFAALALSPKRARAGELLLLSVAAYASLRAWRNIPFFALVAIPALAEHTWCLIESRGWASRRSTKDAAQGVARSATTIALNAALLVCLPVGLCAVKVATVARIQSEVEAREYPAAAVEFLRAHKDAGPVFNAYGWGGYLIWKLYPTRPVFIDGRADVYGDALVEEYLSAEAGEKNWRATLDARGVRTVMIKPVAPLASLLREDAGWNKVFEDEQSVIFFRQ